MKLNDRPYNNWYEGLTIQDVIKYMNYTWPKLVVKVNGQLVWPEDYSNVFLQENDDLKIHHLLAGG